MREIDHGAKNITYKQETYLQSILRRHRKNDSAMASEFCGPETPSIFPPSALIYYMQTHCISCIVGSSFILTGRANLRDVYKRNIVLKLCAQPCALRKATWGANRELDFCGSSYQGEVGFTKRTGSGAHLHSSTVWPVWDFSLRRRISSYATVKRIGKYNNTN